ncbi:MAG: hypothetical protein J5529_12085 [Prevotella sp.]|nr:hypothetical protein [Prevotella sp.]
MLLVAVCCVLPMKAQRKTDVLGRGLVAVPTGSTSGSTTNFVSWRRTAEEYYNTTYNLYRDGTRIATGLTKTSYDDSRCTTSSSYQVAAVVNGVEQAKCNAVKPWTQYVYKQGVRCPTGYINIPLAKVYDRNNNDVTSHYEPNDAEMADLDGDGELEIIIKRLNVIDAGATDANGNSKDIYATNSKEFVVLDAYDVDWQTGAATLLWRIDCGPNMVSLNSTEINIIAYDWDGDGKAEVVLRGADDMIVYGSNGQTKLYTIGVAGANYRGSMKSHSNAQYAWTKDGPEYLVYMNGLTGALYQQTEYPLKRFESGETNLEAAWGDDYGHRSTKHFFGAPVLDGRNASLFLARGIYTRHKMMAMDLNKKTHEWSTRWTWNNNNSSSNWYGQGNHNYIVADVDWDGRDEIIYGSMVIDDNGKGLSTTGLGHGDAMHCSDFDPYRRGQEVFACNEGRPNMNYRDATTSKIYYRSVGSSDDGRALMANLTNNYPGCIGRSVNTDLISSVIDDVAFASPGSGSDNSGQPLYWSHLNFRIYWDGDLCSEILDSPGTAREAAIYDVADGRLFTSDGCNMNNDSKNNPCFQGDIIGDWREEIVVRCGTNLRVYTSGMSTSYNIPTLWHDHQYRQAMVWQMMAYNQPPHTSFFLGEMEGYTVAPPPFSMTDRTEITNGGTIGTDNNGKHVILCTTGNMSATIANGAQPAVITVNAPTWVQGNNGGAITTTTYTHSLNGSPLSGATHLTKQGDGVLNLVNAIHTNTGKTEVWGGTLNFDGTLSASPVTMHRHTTLNSDGGSFPAGITMEYGATLNVGGATSGKVSTVETGTLSLGYGARVVIDYNGTDDNQHDWLNATTLNLDVAKAGVEVWQNYGPQYIVPVIQLRFKNTLPNGIYPIGNVGNVIGDISKVKIESTGIAESSITLVHQDGKLCLEVGGLPTANAPTFALSGMNACDLSSIYPNLPGSNNSYLPVVTITKTKTGDFTPTLSATFTALDGTETYLGSETINEFVNQNYENATGTDGWVNGCNAYLITGDATYGNYINIASENSGGARRSYLKLYDTGKDPYGASNKYTVEFDALFHRSNTDMVNELVLFGEGAVMPAVNTYFNSATNIFRLYGGNNNTNYAVEGNSATASIGDTWCHYTITIDREARTVNYTVKSGGVTKLSGSYTAGNDVNMNVQGIGITLGRAWSYANIDNILIQSEKIDLSTYAFTQPGTLTVTASLGNEAGYLPGMASYVADIPYKCLYESPDYNTIPATSAAETLGSDLWYTNENTSLDGRGWTRFANWANITYAFAINRVNNPNDTMYVDKDKKLWVDYTGNLTALHLVEGYGLAQSGGSTFHAANMGDERAILYHRYDFGLGKTTNIFEEFFQGQEDGTYNYGIGNGALQKFAAYMPLEAIRGDLNHDGYVTVSDVTILVDFILGNANSVIGSEADLNNDGSVSVSDITVLVNIILGM